MNSVQLIGRLTKDPETKYTNSQLAVCKFNLAVDRAVKSGEEKKTDFISVIVFGKTAENLEKYKRKGEQIALTGRIQTGSFEGKDGKMVYTTDVIADHIEFIGSTSHKTDDFSEENPKGKQVVNRGGKSSQNDDFGEAPNGFSYIDEQIPF